MTRHIMVRGGKSGLPYSKGLMANSIVAIGLSPATAYSIAERLEERLRAEGRVEVSVDDLREDVARMLRSEIGTGAAERYQRWQRAQLRDRPLILLVGGATGVGKSTVATQLASLLGITRIVSTDAVREVMRATVSPALLPHLHVSSFETEEVEPVRGVAPHQDPLLAGFLRQTEAVAIGIEQIVRRSVSEHTDTLIEGVHLVPGMVRVPHHEEAVVVQCVLTLDDEDLHRANFTARGQHQRRPHKRYLDHFAEIRTIQTELTRRAADHGVATVRSYALDVTVDEVATLVVDSVSRRPPAG